MIPIQIQNLTTISPVFSKIIYLIKIRDGKQAEKEDLFLRILGVMKGRENVKVESRSKDSITMVRQNFPHPYRGLYFALIQTHYPKKALTQNSAFGVSPCIYMARVDLWKF